MEIDRCRDLRPHLAAFVSEGGDPHLAARIRFHLEGGCASCATEIHELDAAFCASAAASTTATGTSPCSSSITSTPRRSLASSRPSTLSPARLRAVYAKIAMLCLSTPARRPGSRLARALTFDEEH